MVDFRILGPLEALDGEREMPLGGGRQRGVLAILLIHRGRVVSVDRIVDLLWGERPPETAAKTVQVYVSRLRKALGEGLLLTRGAGYVLELAPGQLDADSFERAVSRAREELARENAAAARDLLRGARASGGGRRSPTSPTRTSHATRSTGSRNSGWRRSKSGSRRTSPSAGAPSSFRSSSGWCARTPGASGSGGS